jgi:hypothetical protein
MIANGRRRVSGGRGEIRTHGGLAPTAVFKTAALNHSATLPYHISLGTYAVFCAVPPLAASCSSGEGKSR